MTVAQETPYKQITADGSTTVFSGNFTILSEDDLNVYEDDVLVTTGFTVSGVGVSKGATVTYSTAPTSGVVITLLRSMDPLRSTDYQNSGDFLAGTVNEDFDRLWYFVQQLKRELDLRVLRFEDTETRSKALNTLPAPQVGRFMQWQADNSLANIDLSSSFSAVDADIAESIAAAMLLDLSGKNFCCTISYYGGWAATSSPPLGGATYTRDGTTGTPSTLYSDGSGFYESNGDGFKIALRGIVDVCMFGAKGDGATNDTTSIYNANAHLQSYGQGKLLFPYTGSAYIVSSAVLEISSDFMDWAGDGGLVELKCISPTGDLLKISGNNINIYRLYFGADLTTRTTSGRGVFIDNGETFTQHRVNLIDCQILYQPGNGIEGIKQENARHENLWVLLCGGKGFYFHDNGGTKGINNTFINCRASGCLGTYQWHIYNQSSYTLENCQSLEGAGTHEMFIQSGNMHKINGIDIERATSGGIGILCSGSNHKFKTPFLRNMLTGITVNSGTSVDIENPRLISDSGTPMSIGIDYTNSSGELSYDEATWSNVTTAYTETNSQVRRNDDTVSYNTNVVPLRNIIASAASITPGGLQGNYKQSTLTENTTINNPTNMSLGQVLHFVLVQDGTGGWTATWGSQYKFSTAWSDTNNTAGKQSTIAFIWTGTYMMQCAPQVGWV